jgi:hypothetical protein
MLIRNLFKEYSLSGSNPSQAVKSVQHRKAPLCPVSDTDSVTIVHKIKVVSVPGWQRYCDAIHGDGLVI